MYPREPHEVSGFEGQGFLMASVIVLLVLGLGLLELGFGLIMDLMVLLHESFGRGVWACSWASRHYSEGAARVETIVGKQRRQASRGVSGVVVSEFSQG